MKRLMLLALALALLALSFGALAEENYEAANYETLKQVQADTPFLLTDRVSVLY